MSSDAAFSLLQLQSEIQGRLSDQDALAKSAAVQLSSTKKTFSTLAVFYDWLEEEGMAFANPVRAFSKKVSPESQRRLGRKKIISIEDAARMVAATIDSRTRQFY